MSEWVRLGDVADILDSQRIPITASERVSGPYPYYGANGIQDYVHDYIFDEELVLLAEDGGNFGSKDKPIAYRVSGKCWVNNHAHVLRPKENIDVNFLCYSLMYYDVSKLTSGSTRLKLTQAAMREMQVPHLTLSEQQHIVSVLDTVNSLIDARKKQIALLDEAEKSLFVEMFGDPVENPKGWIELPLSNICSSIIRGPFGSSLKKEFFVEPSDSTYKVYEQKHAIQKSATIGTYYITKEKYEGLKRFECFPGDIIMSCSGTMGELFQLPMHCERGVINQALCKFTLSENILSCYFIRCLRMTIKNLETKGSGIKNIAAVSYVKSLLLPLPPLPIQKEFASWIEKIENQRSMFEHGLTKLEEEYEALMQEYFG